MRILLALTAALILSACASGTTRVAPIPTPAPLDLGCERCTAAAVDAACPALPELVPAADGTAALDDVLALGPEDGRVNAACRAYARECAACLDRGRAAKVIR